MKKLLFAFVFVISTAAVAWADSPPSKYIDQGACPFECCVYRTWTAKIDTAVYAKPDKNAKVVGRLNAGVAVEAITGEVHSRPVRFIVKKPRGGYKPRDVLWVYTYLGEGHFKVWWNGAMREESLNFSPYGGSAGTRCENTRECWGELDKELEFEWWVKVRTKEGWEGWSNQPDHFGNKDACE